MLGETGEMRARLGGDAGLQVDLMEAVDADQQHVTDAKLIAMHLRRRCGGKHD